MSFEVIGHDKNGFVVKRFDSARLGARAAATIARKTRAQTTLIDQRSRAKLMVCEFRVPHEGRNFAKCKLTPAGEKLLRDKPKKRR